MNDNNEKLYLLFKSNNGTINKYFEESHNLINKLVGHYFSALYSYESLVNDDSTMAKIEGIDKISLKDIKVYFTSLFDATNTTQYLIIVRRIQDFLKKYLINDELEKNEFEKAQRIDYPGLIDYIKCDIKNIINDLKFPIDFDYVLNQKDEVEEEEIQSNEPVFVHSNIEYSNLDYIPLLLKEVVERLSKLSKIIDTYSLLSLQQIDLSLDQYIALSECFIKVKNSRMVKVDIANIINTLIEADTDDYYDIFSENYVTFVATILECAYFLCYYFIVVKTNDNKKKYTKHKNCTLIKINIVTNIELFLDKVKIECDINWLDLYSVLYNMLINYDTDLLIDQYREFNKEK